MARRKLHRRSRGTKFSEGTRLLWLRVIELGWTQKDLTDRFRLASGIANRTLFGDRTVSLPEAIRYRDELGIPIEAWDAKPTERFRFPESLPATEAA